MARQKAQALGEVRDGLVRYSEDGNWFYSVRFHGRKRQGDLGTKSRTAAVERLAKLREQWGAQEVDGRWAMVTLRQLHEEWQRVRGPEVGPGHAAEMRTAVEVHAAEWLDEQVAKLDSLRVNQIRSAYLQNEGLGIRKSHTPGGANQMVKQLRALCGWGVIAGILKAVPFKLKKLAVTEKRAPVLWPEQVPAFLAAIDRGRHYKGRTYPHSATAARLMIGLGLREDECRHAEWTHVDMRNWVWRISRGEAVENDPKDRQARAIPIPPSLQRHLLLLWEEQGRPQEGLMLPAEDGKPHRPQFTEAAVKRAAGIVKAPGLTPHRLRATFASGHHEVGTPMSQIAQMMGHTDPETTRRHYIVERPKDQVEAQAKLDATMGLDQQSHISPTKPKAKNKPNNIINKKR